MDRFNFFFRQKVTEAELDAAFDAVESSIASWIGDFDYVGVARGAVLAQAPAPDFTIRASGPGTVFDQLHQRIGWSPEQSIDLAFDENSNPTAVVGGANSRWLSVFARFLRIESDIRTDGNQQQLTYSSTESFVLKVASGAEGVSPTKPVLRADEILLGDVLIVFGQVTVLDGDIDITRREDIYRLTGSPLSIQESGFKPVLQAMVDTLNAFDATTIPVTVPTLWANSDGISSGSPSDIEAVINALMDDVASTSAVAGGTNHVGGGLATSGGVDVSDPPSVAVGTLRSQILSVLDQLANRARLDKENLFTQVDNALSSLRFDDSASVGTGVRKLTQQFKVAETPDRFVRFYSVDSPVSFEVVYGAAWNPGTSLWVPDQVVNPGQAFKLLFSALGGLQWMARTDLSGNWGDAAWDDISESGQSEADLLISGQFLFRDLAGGGGAGSAGFRARTTLVNLANGTVDSTTNHPVYIPNSGHWAGAGAGGQVSVPIDLPQGAILRQVNMQHLGASAAANLGQLLGVSTNPDVTGGNDVTITPTFTGLTDDDTHTDALGPASGELPVTIDNNAKWWVAKITFGASGARLFKVELLWDDPGPRNH